MKVKKTLKTDFQNFDETVKIKKTTTGVLFINDEVESKKQAHLRKIRENLVKARANKKPPTTEVKAKISASLKGHKVSDETRAKLSAAKKGQRKGTTLPAEQKAKISASLKNYWAS